MALAAAAPVALMRQRVAMRLGALASPLPWLAWCIGTFTVRSGADGQIGLTTTAAAAHRTQLHSHTTPRRRGSPVRRREPHALPAGRDPAVALPAQILSAAPAAAAVAGGWPSHTSLTSLTASLLACISHLQYGALGFCFGTAGVLQSGGLGMLCLVDASEIQYVVHSCG